MRKHEKEILQAQLDNEKAVLKQLERNYADALEEVNSKIAELMGRADADMQHVIYQVDYQRALKAQIQGILKTLQSNEFSTVSEYLTKCYDEGFLGTMYSLQEQGVPLVIPMNQEEIAAAIQHETNLSSGLYASFDTADLQKKIASEISRGFTVGSSFSEIARNVASYAGVSRNNANRIVRTEGHRIVETAAHHAQQKAKARGADVVKIWDASLDAKTRDSHVRVDGEIREVDEKFSNGLMFPGDPSGRAAEVINCRCRARTDARWALDAHQTKMLGDTSKLKPEQRETIAKKLGIPEDALDQYSGQIVPIKAKDYKDFKNQYNKLWQYEGSDLRKQAEGRIAKMETAKNVKKNASSTKGTLENSAKGSTIVSGQYPEYSRIIRDVDAVEDAKKANPNYSKHTYEYTNNCQRCVPAWELRQRGFDVIAQPCKPAGEHDALKTSPFSLWQFNPFDKDTSKRVQVDREGNGKDGIIEFLKASGNGARAEIVVAWDYNPAEGHAFVAKNVDGEILFIDPQNGKSGKFVEDYFDRVVQGETRWLRIDNLPLAEQYRKEVIANPYERLD